MRAAAGQVSRTRKGQARLSRKAVTAAPKLRSSRVSAWRRPSRGDAGGTGLPRDLRRLRPRAWQRLLVDLGLDEDVEDLTVQLPRLRLVAQDAEGALDGHRLLVGAVPGHEGVEDVGDGHHARLD